MGANLSSCSHPCIPVTSTLSQEALSGFPKTDSLHFELGCSSWLQTQKSTPMEQKNILTTSYTLYNLSLLPSLDSQGIEREIGKSNFLFISSLTFYELLREKSVLKVPSRDLKYLVKFSLALLSYSSIIFKETNTYATLFSHLMKKKMSMGRKFILRLPHCY